MLPGYVVSYKNDFSLTFEDTDGLHVGMSLEWVSTTRLLFLICLSSGAFQFAAISRYSVYFSCGLVLDFWF